MKTTKSSCTYPKTFEEHHVEDCGIQEIVGFDPQSNYIISNRKNNVREASWNRSTLITLLIVNKFYMKDYL